MWAWIKSPSPASGWKKSGGLCRVHAADSAQAETAGSRLKNAFEISARRPARTPLVVEIISR